MKPNTLIDAIRCGDTAKALSLLEHGADPLRHGVIWMDQALDIEPPHFRPSMALKHLEDWAEGPIDAMPEEEAGNANDLPTMIVTPIQMALLTQNLELVEKLLDLGVKPDPKALAIYPYREAVRMAKAQILARLAEEEPSTPEVIMEYPAPRKMEEWTRLACRVVQVLLQDSSKATRYPEMVEELDLLRWADYEYVHPALVEPFRRF